MTAVSPGEAAAYAAAMRSLESFCEELGDAGLDEAAVLTLLLSRAAAMARDVEIDREVLAEACVLAFDCVQPEVEDPQ